MDPEVVPSVILQAQGACCGRRGLIQVPALTRQLVHNLEPVPSLSQPQAVIRHNDGPCPGSSHQA